MATNTLPRPRSEKRHVLNVFLWALQIAVAVFMLRAAFPKLTDDSMMVQLFGVIGLGQWFRYLTGSLEVAGAIGLLIPGLAGYAALLLAAVMGGAVVSHVLVLGGSPLIPLGLLAADVIIAWGRLWRKI